MAVDPEALQRAMRAQFPAPELAPEASDWMREIVAAVGSNPFIHRERDVLKFVEAPLNRLKSEPPEVRLAFVFEALNEIVRSSSFHFKLVLKVVVASLLRSGVALSAVEAVRLVELVSQPKLPFPFKAVLSAIEGAPRTPALLTALHQLRGSVTRYHGLAEMKEIHERIDVLIGGPKEEALAPAGAWSQIVFREVSASGKEFEWRALLLHARSLTQSTASKKWQTEAVNLTTRIGQAEVLDAARRWLALGPTPGETTIQAPEAEASLPKGVRMGAGRTRRCFHRAGYRELRIRVLPEDPHDRRGFTSGGQCVCERIGRDARTRWCGAIEPPGGEGQVRRGPQADRKGDERGGRAQSGIPRRSGSDGRSDVRPGSRPASGLSGSGIARPASRLAAKGRR